jgi:hypothetical protein
VDALQSSWILPPAIDERRFARVLGGVMSGAPVQGPPFSRHPVGFPVPRPTQPRLTDPPAGWCRSSRPGDLPPDHRASRALARCVT